MAGESTVIAETQDVATNAPLSATQQARHAANRIQTLLGEDNHFLVFRLVQLFGLPLIEAKAEEALRVWQAARDEGAGAYIAQPGGTWVAKSDGSPRSKGGVFFMLMREHCQNIGLNWSALFPPQSQRKAGQQTANSTTANAPLQAAQAAPRPNPPKPEVAEGRTSSAAPPNPMPTATPISAAIQSLTSPKPVADKAAPALTDTLVKPKPSRGKVTITGTLAAAPKRDAEKGLVELVFGIEMSAGLPKGLPNLGTSRVTVICTIKQFEKLAETTTITPQTRFMVEGEPSPVVNRELQPFLKVVCLRLTTLEAEQARHSQ